MITIIDKLPLISKHPLPERQCIDDELEVYRLLQNGSNTELKVLRLVAGNYQAIPFLLKMIPLPMWINLHQKYDLLDNYYHQSLLQELFNINKASLYIEIVTESEHESTLLLNNHLSEKYNFGNDVFQERLTTLQEDVPELDLNNFILGEDTVMFLASFEQPQDVVLTLYPITRTIKWELHSCVFEDTYCIIKCSNLTFKISTHITTQPKKLLWTQGVIYNPKTNEIRCVPEFYQSLTDTDYEFEEAVVLEGNLSYGFTTHPEIGIQNPGNVKRCYSSQCRQMYCLETSLPGFTEMCYNCGVINYSKRNDQTDLSGRSVYVSGGRIKIGYYTAIKLLRCGAKVIVSTRYPSLARYNFSNESDYQEWNDRLEIIKCDFTNFPEVMDLIKILQEEKLDILINNACQTVKPTDYYLDRCYELETHLLTLEGRLAICSPQNNFNKETEIVTFMRNHSIELNQFKDVYDPTMMKDSSWFKTIDELDTEEILQVNVINQIVPTMLVNQVLPTMKEKMVIMVTAVEGQFSKGKEKAVHAHTNMCKAGINMMVRTLGESEDKDLHIYAVDPGFVSGVNPFKDRYPLKPEDGAARILDPIFQLYRGNPIRSGIKLKDFEKSSW